MNPILSIFFFQKHGKESLNLIWIKKKNSKSTHINDWHFLYLWKMLFTQWVRITVCEYHETNGIIIIDVCAKKMKIKWISKASQSFVWQWANVDFSSMYMIYSMVFVSTSGWFICMQISFKVHNFLIESLKWFFIWFDLFFGEHLHCNWFTRNEALWYG